MKIFLQILCFFILSISAIAQRDTLKIGQFLISKSPSNINKSWEDIIKNRDLKGVKVVYEKN